MDETQSRHDELDVWLSAFRAALEGPSLAQPLPPHGHPDWAKLLDDLVAIRRFVKDLSTGDLSGELRVRGHMAGSLKALQANLRHLTWQVQQVAQGDFSQRIDFMGDFSEAFHAMTDSLRQSRAEERAQRLLAEALRDAAAALNSALGLDEVLDVILTSLDNVVPHDTLDIFLVDEQGIASVARASGYDRVSPGLAEQVKSLRLSVARTPNLLQMAHTHEPCRIDDLSQFQWVHIIDDHWAKSFLGAPILIEDHVAGFFSLLSKQAGFFSSEHASRLMTFANQTAVALQKVRLIERLNWLATTDSLTGIANRRHFMELARQECERSLRYGDPLSALMIDIDLFKVVNDTYGHAVGDEVLREVAQTVRRALRVVDLLGRYGGEEFVVLLPSTGLEAALGAAERVRETLAEKKFSSAGQSLHVTVSVGVSALRESPDSLALLLNRADQALYTVKQSGRNSVAVLA